MTFDDFYEDDDFPRRRLSTTDGPGRTTSMNDETRTKDM